MDSVIPSELQQIEVIIIHDGGTDGALEVALRWIEEISIAALVVDQENSGLSAARMAGLEYATGLCVAFLDSDDIADAEVLLAMARDIEERDCDLVLARSAVLDGTTLGAAPFYDAWIWDDMMRGMPFRRVTLAQEPRLLRLEPNANTRVLRRSFVDRVGISFPTGRLYEDPPAHVQGIVHAAAIGLRNETLYLYRVNRAGKITDERSSRRFDAIATNREAIEIAAATHVTPEAGANLLIAAARMLFWCCQNVANADRLRFATEAGAALRVAPDAWRTHATTRSVLDEREALILGALLNGDPRVIVPLSARRRPSVTAALRFAATPYGHPARRVIRRIVLNVLGGPFRRAWSMMRRVFA
jgi:hypothetical protein